MTDTPIDADLERALAEYLRVLPAEARTDTLTRLLRDVAATVRDQGAEIAEPPSETARLTLSQLAADPETDGRHAIEREVRATPAPHSLDLLRSLYVQARRERRLFERIVAFAAADDDAPTSDDPARERLRTRFDWQIRRDELDPSGDVAHTDRADAEPKDSSDCASDE